MGASMLWRLGWFRWTAYFAARSVGKVKRTLGSGWCAHAIGLAAVAAAVAGLWRLKSGPQGDPRTLISWTFAAEAVVGYVLLWLIVRAYRRRQRLVIQLTVNHAGKEFDNFAAGLAADLANHLGQLGELYKTIDEANPPAPIGKGGAGISDLKVGVDNPGDQLANVVGEKSSVKLGPLDVSLRPFVALVERFVPNQRLSSSLHRTGNRLTLLAQMPRMERNWRVVRDLPAVASEDEQARALTAMKEELVYRVCTAVVQTGSPRWEAVKRFSDGLREYRRTLSSDTGKELHLRHAEEGFRAARSIDRDFARCSYNLGVVYRQRGRIDSAKAAFERALEEDPAHADAAHALAAIYLAEGSSNPQKGALARSLEFAERAIALAPRDIRGWNIKGNVWRRLQAAPDSGAAWRSCLSFHETAAALAWRALCGAARRGQPLDAASKALAIPFADLAYVHSQLGRRRRAARILPAHRGRWGDRGGVRQRPPRRHAVGADGLDLVGGECGVGLLRTVSRRALPRADRTGAR